MTKERIKAIEIIVDKIFASRDLSYLDFRHIDLDESDAKQLRKYCEMLDTLGEEQNT